MNTRNHLSLSLVCLALSLCALVACSGRDLAPTPGDAIPEVSASGQSLAETYTRQGTWWVSPTLETPRGATQVGTMLTTYTPETSVRMEARGVFKDGSKSAWVPFKNTWSEQKRSVTLAVLGDLVHSVQIRIADRDIRNVDVFTWSALIPEQNPKPDNNELETRGQALDTAFVNAGIRPRSDWGARATNCSGQDPSKYRVAVHHTVTPTSQGGDYAAQLRQIQNYHMNTRGWCDVGYHFLVTANGETWEARPVQYLGAHVGGNNTGNVGVSFVGCFHPTSDCSSFQPNVPPQEMINSAGSAIGAIVAQYSIPINATNIKGHRDHSGASTSCPGDNLHARLGELREIAGGGAVDPKGTVQGVVWDASVTDGPADDGNVRIDSARVVCSCGQEMDVASGNAFWSFQVPPGTHTITASAPGYATASREITVTANVESWSSVGLQPENVATPTSAITMLVFDASIGTNAPISGASIEGRDFAALQSDAAGNATTTVPTGTGTIDLTVRAEGFETQTFTLPLQPNQPATLQAGLQPINTPQPDVGLDTSDADTSEQDTSGEDTSLPDVSDEDTSTPDASNEDTSLPDAPESDTGDEDSSGEDTTTPPTQAVTSNDFCSIPTRSTPSQLPYVWLVLGVCAVSFALRRRR